MTHYVNRANLRLPSGVVYGEGDLLTLADGSEWVWREAFQGWLPSSIRAISATPRNSLITVACGNSITAKSKKGNTGANGWDTSSDLHWGNALCGSVARFARMTETTRSDLHGIYSHPGQTLDTIITDMEVQWFAQFEAAGVVPELFIGHALLENDLAQGATVPEMIARLTTWIANVRRYPGVLILLCTPRPSFNMDTPAKVAAFVGITEYILNLDNGRDTFVARMNAYENPLRPGVPLPGYTDSSVHPNARGAYLNASTLARALRRILVAPRNYPLKSINYGLTGVTPASAVTGVSGTMPTGAGISAISNGGTIFSTAENPGWLVRVSQSAGMTGGKTTFHTGAVAVAGGANTQLSLFMEVEIVSGAEFLSGIFVGLRVQDTAGNLFQHLFAEVTAMPDLDYTNGEVLTFVQPPIVAQTAPITAATPYMYLRHKTGGSGTVTVTGDVEVRIRRSGVGIVVA